MMRIFCSIVLCLFIAQAHGEFSREFMDQQPVMTANTGSGVDIAYQVIGEPDQPAVVLIMGLGASHTLWGDDFVKGLHDVGYRVVLIDNRDVGASTRFTAWGEPTLWWELLKNTVGLSVNAPYLLDDMANDVIGVMDALAIDKAHIVGASMGGMIAQIIAANYPQRTQSLVSIMSTTGAPHLPPPSGDSANMIQDLAAGDGDSRVAAMQARGFFPEAIPRQLMAIIKTGDRSSQVASIETPTLVLHGADDTLLPPAHGEHTAELIKGSSLKIFAGMGHNLPDAVMPDLLATMTSHMRQNDLAPGLL